MDVDIQVTVFFSGVSQIELSMEIFRCDEDLSDLDSDGSMIHKRLMNQLEKSRSHAGNC